MRFLSVEEREDLEQVDQDRAMEDAERLEWIAEQVCEHLGVIPEQHAFVEDVVRWAEKVAQQWPPPNTDHLPI
jgi:hypothetical protein